MERPASIIMVLGFFGLLSLFFFSPQRPGQLGQISAPLSPSKKIHWPVFKKQVGRIIHEANQGKVVVISETWADLSP